MHFVEVGKLRTGERASELLFAMLEANCVANCLEQRVRNCPAGSDELAAKAGGCSVFLLVATEPFGDAWN